MPIQQSPIQAEIRNRFQLVPTLLHLTRIENLKGIFEEGFIFSKSIMSSKDYVDISDAQVQDVRSRKKAPPSGRSLHDYVPLFVSYKAPMVAKVQHLNPRLVYLEIPMDIFSRRQGTLIADGNAASTNTKIVPFRSIEDIKILDLSIVQKTVGYSNDSEKARKKSAEVLVPDKISVSEIQRMAFYCSEGENEGLEILSSFGKKLKTFYRTDWFFNSDRTSSNG